MTDIHKLVQRRTIGTYSHHKKRIVVSIEPGDILGMRLERSTAIYRAPISSVFNVLAKWYADSVRQLKREARMKEGHGIGRREA